MEEVSPSIGSLKEQFHVLGVEIFRREITVEIPKEEIVEICKYLYSDPDLQYRLLTDLCGLDLFPQIPRFAVVYHLCSVKNNQRLRLRAKVGERESISSVESIWKVANWYEREAYDLFGIHFGNHPDLRRILLWDGYEGYPLRKDYPVEGPDFDKPFVPEV